MRERSVRQRNFVGAFLGGALGILLCAFLHPYALPVGCVVGVIGGWWYQEISQSSTRGWRWSRNVLPEKARRARAFSFERAHPIRQAYTVKTLAGITHVVLNVVLLAALCWMVHTCGSLILPKEDLVGLVLIDVVLGIIFGYIVIARPLCDWGDIDLPPVVSGSTMTIIQSKKNLHNWKLYKELGASKFFWKNFFSLLGYGFAGFLPVFGTCFCVLISAFAICFMILPTIITFAVAKLIYLASTKTGHWLCLVATMVVTLTTAWLTYPYFGDVRVVWLVALTNGLASAVVTEVARTCLAWFFEKYERVRMVMAGSIIDHTKPIESWVDKIWDEMKGFSNRMSPELI